MVKQMKEIRRTRKDENEIVVNKCFDLVHFDLCKTGKTKLCIQPRRTKKKTKKK